MTVTLDVLKRVTLYKTVQTVQREMNYKLE